MRFKPLLAKVLRLTIIQLMVSLSLFASSVNRFRKPEIIYNCMLSLKAFPDKELDSLNLSESRIFRSHISGKNADHSSGQIYQQKVVSGKVVDEKSGEAIPGVIVKLKGTSKIASTDKDGIFTITVPDREAILVFSFVGYEQQEQSTGTSNKLNIFLKESSTALSDVVIVGYGKQKRAFVTGSVGSANLEVLRDSPNTNIGQYLQGAVPGLNVNAATSAGGTPAISIRGQNTLSGNTNVLIILDGIQYNSNLSSINPDDIASIDVLKDASSTAVYGAQAANGVLLITTRKGQGKPRISFSTSYATQTPSVQLRPLNREEYLNRVRLLNYNTAFLAPAFTEPNPAFDLGTKVDISQRDGSGGIVPTDYNWYDQATDDGFIFDNQLSISGSSDRVNYLLSTGYTKQEGFIINDKFERKSLRANIEVKATDWMKVGLQSFGSFVNQDGAEPTLLALFRMAPLNSPYLPNGELNPTPFNTVDANPFLTYDVQDYDRTNYLFANLYADIDFPFLKGLNYRMNFGNNHRNDRHYGASKYANAMAGSAYKNSEQYYDYTVDNILTYNQTFEKHSVTGTLVYGVVERQNDYFQASGSGFSRLTLGYNNLQQATNQFITSSAYKEALNYQMGRVNYAYDAKYLVTATLRRDGFSGFAQNNKYAVFPSVSVGWNLTEESFFKLTAINSLKLRAGYGVSGNQTPRYSSLDRASTQASYVFGDGGTTQLGQSINSLPNPNLKWEKTYETNMGIDFSIFNNRLSGTFDYYNRHTKDLLYSVPVPTITGFGSIQTNVGEVGNRGFEISLNSKNISGKYFQWNTTFNFSRNVNRIKELLGRGDLVSSNLFIGQPISVVYGYRTDGIYQIGDQIPAGYSPGTYRIVDVNGDGQITTADREILGTGNTAFRFSFINTLKYKSLSLTFVVNSNQGGKNGYFSSNSASRVLSDNSVRNNDISSIDYWSPLNPNGRYASSLVSPAINPTLYQQRNFVRLQDLTLSYGVEGSILRKIGVQKLNVFLSGKNLVTWTKFEGWDPETSNGGLSTEGRPLMKGYSLGLNFTL